MLESGDMTEQELNGLIKAQGVLLSKEMSKDEFVRIVRAIDQAEEVGEEEEDDSEDSREKGEKSGYLVPATDNKKNNGKYKDESNSNSNGNGSDVDNDEYGDEELLLDDLAGKSISLSVYKFRGLVWFGGLFLYTGGVLFHVESCTRQL